jgi:hypothetical protein
VVSTLRNGGKNSQSMNWERSDWQDRPNLLDLIQTKASAKQCTAVKDASGQPLESEFSLAHQRDTGE